jgi:hypothetical protein
MLRTIFHVAEHARAPPEIKESTLLSPTHPPPPYPRDNPFDAAIRHPVVVSLGEEKKKGVSTSSSSSAERKS